MNSACKPENLTAARTISGDKEIGTTMVTDNVWRTGIYGWAEVVA